MSTDEREIHALHNFRAGLAEPSAERLTRLRCRVADPVRDQPVRPRWSARGLAVPAIAAGAVLAVATSAAVIGLGGSSSSPGSSPGSSRGSGSGSVSTSPAGPGVVRPSANTGPLPAEKTASQADPVDPGAHHAAINQLEQFAVAAGAAPAPLDVPAGRFLYIRGEGVSTKGTANSSGGSTEKSESYLHELWLEPDGNIVRMIRRTDNGAVTIVEPDPSNPKSLLPQEAERQRADLDRLGPSLDRPTRAFLASLPTDPDRLLKLLRGRVQSPNSWSSDRAIFDGLRNLLYNNEPLLTGPVRAALYRAIAKLGSVTSGGPVTGPNGRRLVAIGQAERGERQEFLFDADTGRVAGSRTIRTGETDPGFFDLWSYTAVVQPGDTA